MRALYIEPDSPWENGYVESSNGRIRDELLNVEVFDLWCRRPNSPGRRRWILSLGVNFKGSRL